MMQSRKIFPLKSPLADRGAILINALVIMALLSGTAVALQMRTQQDITRIQSRADAAQGALYLDSAMALAALALRLDSELTSSDHHDEDWARDDIVVPIDRGIIAVQLADLQGRFNLNSLGDPRDPFDAQPAFLRLADHLGISERSAQDIIAYIRENGPLRGSEALATIASLSADQRRLLETHVTMLPGNPTINLNTASRMLLASIVPQIEEEDWEVFEEDRATTPLDSRAPFEAFLAAHLSTEDLADINFRRFEARSEHFAVEATVTLGKMQWSRQTWLMRNSDGTVRRFYQARVY